MENVKRLSAERLRPIRDEVYHRIRQAILRGTYKPGGKLQDEMPSSFIIVRYNPL